MSAPSADPPAAFAPGLVLVSTPIGNLGDVTGRALAALRGADLLLCEDTRATARLLSAHGVSVRTEALHDHNEEARIPALLERLRRGERIALVSDAGTPLLADPGYRLTRAALAEGLPVTAAPGANAALTALTLSGLPPHPFLFLGFPPAKRGARLAGFTGLHAAELAGLRATLVWYEAPHRVAGMLEDLLATFGDRPAALARELTKKFEEVRRDGLAGLVAGCAADPPRGEIVVLVGPAAEGGEAVDVDGMLRRAMAGHGGKEAVAMVAAAAGLPKKVVYGRMLAMRGDGG